MLKTALIALGCSTAAATATLVFVGRTVHSSPFQMDIPYLTALKTTPDPANIWSWHHTFATPGTVDVLVDVDGNNVMDTEHSWLRVMVTDIEVVDLQNNSGIAFIRDSTGRRFAVSNLGGGSGSKVEHVALSTPIVLPIGSSLFVELASGGPGTEVHLIGRVVNL